MVNEKTWVQIAFDRLVRELIAPMLKRNGYKEDRPELAHRARAGAECLSGRWARIEQALSEEGLTEYKRLLAANG